MRILLINKYSEIKGGSERYVYNIKELLEQAGHSVYLFTMDQPKKLKRSLFWSGSANTVLREVLNEFRPDIAHCHNIYHDFSPSILFVLKKYKIPVVMTLHDYKIICPNYKLFNNDKVCEKCKITKYYNCMVNNCFNNIVQSTGACMESYLHNSILKSYKKNVDVFISPSKFLKQKIKDWGVSNKVVHLSNFVNVPDMNVDKKNYLLYFGRLEKEKGINVLTEAMKQLPNERLIIVGTGKIKINTEKNIESLGYLTGDKLYKLVAEAKAVIVPSIWHENNPLNVLEALALGTWVIGSDIGGIPELIHHEENGQLFEANKPKDLIIKINKLNSLNYHIKKQEIITAKEHLEKIISIYKEL